MKKKTMNETNTKKPYPPGRTKIINSLRTLLETKDFSSIKIADIANTAGVTEPLIYKYFKDKRDVLHNLLQEYLEVSYIKAENELKEIDGALNKLKHFAHSYISAYDKDRVIARVILLEVQNSGDYYESESYSLLKKYGELIHSIILEGVKNGEIRDDIDPVIIRHTYFGGIDRACLSPIIYNRPIKVKKLTDQLTTLFFDAVRK